MADLHAADSCGVRCRLPEKCLLRDLYDLLRSYSTIINQLSEETGVRWLSLSEVPSVAICTSRPDVGHPTQHGLCQSSKGSTRLQFKHGKIMHVVLGRAVETGRIIPSAK